MFVPINPLFEDEQVEHILRDSNVRVLVISPERFARLATTTAGCVDLRHRVPPDGAEALPLGRKRYLSPLERID